MNKGTSVLVTGCAGFIGSHIAERLLNENYSVLGIDNFSTGYRQNITHLMDHDKFTFYELDILDLDKLTKLFKDHDITHVSHQAARASVPKSVEDPLKTNEINVQGTLNLLRLSHKHHIQKFVCAISSSIYGNTPTLPKVETMPYCPESPYAVTKVAKEMYCKLFWDLYKLPTIGLRYFNVYGPKQDPNGAYAAVIPRRIQAALQNQHLPLNGEGNQTRDFTFIHDVVEKNLLALFTDNKDAYGKGFNVAYGQRVSIKELGETIINSIGGKSKLVTAPSRQGDITDSFADISLASELLNYQPQYSIAEGIHVTIEWYKSYPDYFTSN